jgi:hypothetical protein
LSTEDPRWAISVCATCSDDIELLDFGAEGLRWAHFTMEPDRGHEAEPLPPPTRACCGQPHAGATCSDGLVMCCLCFERVKPEDLATEDGQRVDVCRPCMEQEP